MECRFVEKDSWRAGLQGRCHTGHDMLAVSFSAPASCPHGHPSNRVIVEPAFEMKERAALSHMSKPQKQQSESQRR